MKTKKIILKTGKWLLISIGGVVGVLLVLLLVIWVNSSGTAEPMVDEQGNEIPNSIAVIKDTVINGASQRLTIRGEDLSNPVLLRIHGGPGQPHSPQAFKFIEIDLEDHFTVCYWDQRGAGPAYSPNIPDSTITREQIVEDGLDVSEYLVDRFEKDKIYIEGISWGTAVGAFMAKRQPELYKAFIGVGQVSNRHQNEIMSYNFVMNEALSRNDTTAVNALTEIGRPPYKTDEERINAVQVERSYVSKYVPSKMDMNTLDKLKLMLLYEGWSFNYKWKILSEGMYGIAAPLLWSANADLNLFDEVPDWDIPVYILHGENDHFAETALAKAYFDSLKAPVKKFYLFDDTGHFASAEAPEKYRKIVLEEILNKER